MRNGIIVLVVLLLFSCKRNYDAPCRDSYTNYYDLGSNELALWPFVSKDTLYFSNQNGDTVTFMSTQVNHWYDYFTIPNNPECAADSEAYENKFIALTDTVNLFSFYSDMQQLNEKVTVSAGTQVWEFSTNALSNADSATFDSLSFHGTSFKKVFSAQSTNGDSLYYSPISGIVRYKTATKTLDKWLLKK